MTVIDKSSYSIMDKEILYDEYVNLKNTVKQYSILTPFYVYAICKPNGEPIYIGKGSGFRAFDHLKNFINNKLENKMLMTELSSLSDPPIMYIIRGNLDQQSALDLERETISEYGRQINGGTLTNIMPGGSFSNYEYNQSAGFIGGKITKDNKLGIFSDDYDRSSQSKSNWENGLMDHLNFQEIGALGGAAAVEQQLGIHDPKYSDKRTEWAKIGAKASQELGLFGVCNSEWRKENKEKLHTILSKNGTKGGKVVGALPWWTNGKENKKAVICPDGFKSGMTRKEKLKS